MAAEAIVSSVLEQLSSIIGRELEQEVRLVVGVEEAVKKLTNNFQAIQAVLVDAEQKQLTDKAVGIWLGKLKDTSYDIDDVLDEWNTEILKLQVKGSEKFRILKKVCFMFSSPCFCFRQVALRHDIGVKIKEINEKLDSIAIEKDRYNLSQITSVKKPQRLPTTSFTGVSEICGRDEIKNYLVNKLLGESKEEKNIGIPIISIVGMGGIGKTTLAQLAYNDTKVESNFDERIWVCVSEPFNELRIAKAIIERLRGEAPNLVELESHLDCIRKTIKNKKFLLIFDDVWTEDYDEWGPLYNSLNSGLHCGSKIVVTTRKENVARMMKSIDVINIGELSVDESWLLFKQLAFYDKSQEECERLEDIGIKIVGKCKGLPLAIKTIGSLLQSKKTRDQWQKILDSKIWELKESEKGLFPALLLSYHELSSTVKQCFSYCAIFPKDYEINKDELIKLWMAQGYLDLNQDEELEIIGEECFDTLVMHSLFQEFKKDDYDSIYGCKMHDIVHDFTQYLVKNECFTKEINWGKERSLTFSCENARHSMFILSSLYDVNLRSVEKLRSLLIECRGIHTSSTVDYLPNLFGQLTSLRALMLSDTSHYNVYNIPRKIGKLIHLRYLNLSQLIITELPETLCCLYNLQTLNFTGCHLLQKLPEGMGKLINLRHLINERPEYLKYIPKGIERLVYLRTLSAFVVGVDAHRKGMVTLECLKNLNKLRGDLMLRGLGIVEDEAEAKNAELMNKKNLIGLKLWFDDPSKMPSSEMPEERIRKDSAVLEALRPPPTLERLLISWCKSMASPRWMLSLTHLKSLTLYYFIKSEYLPPLGKLPLLQSLEILGFDSLKRVSNEFVGMETSSSSSPPVVAFPKLKSLDFQYMYSWEDWEYQMTGDITIMPSLSSLQFNWCPKLKSLPDQLLRATSLKRLKMIDCPILVEKYRLFVSHEYPGADATIENSP